mmetsp:Transcript_7029/g.16080  ORF Transcript_7029/g.16080 Transcript_7029/m.16080 type:complete len:262 (-) Transcript_7029:377-1162(-)
MIPVINNLSVHILASRQVHEALVLRLLGRRMVVTDCQEENGPIEVTIGELLHKDKIVRRPAFFLVDLCNSFFSCSDRVLEIFCALLYHKLATHAKNTWCVKFLHGSVHGKHRITKIVVGDSYGLHIFQFCEQIECFGECVVCLRKVTRKEGRGRHPDHQEELLKSRSNLPNLFRTPFHFRKLSFFMRFPSVEDSNPSMKLTHRHTDRHRNPSRNEKDQQESTKNNSSKNGQGDVCDSIQTRLFRLERSDCGLLRLAQPHRK